MGAAANTKVICVGDKSRAFMARYFPKNLIMVGSEIGRLPPQFGDAAAVANAILNSGVDYDQGKMVYNKYKSVVSYDTTAIPLFSQETVMGAEMKEGACSEQSSRMTAMDNSSKNAGEMIDKLTITFNRTRQAVITGELIEIISGAAA